MRMIDLNNYHHIFSNRFNEKERKNFLFSYEACLRELCFKSFHPDHPESSDNPVEEFIKEWKSHFDKQEYLLKELLLHLKPREVYAIIDLCDR